MSSPGDRSVPSLTQLNTIQGNEIIYAYSPGLAIDARFTPALLVPYIQQFIPQGPPGPTGQQGPAGSPQAGIDIVFTGDGGGALIIGTVDIPVPFNCTLTEGAMYGDQTGSIVVDILKATHAAYPTFSSITGGNPLTIASDVKMLDATLAGWSKTLVQGDILRLSITSVSGFTKVSLALEMNKT